MIRQVIAAAVCALMLSSCTVYHPAPVLYAPASPSAYERSWNATLGAFQDQGVAISSADRSTGIVRGRRGETEIIANLSTQSDGSVRVQFNTRGANAQDPHLIDRVSQSFDARMGR
jgi:hypothetical protein